MTRDACEAALAESDVRATVRLLGEIIATPGDFREKRRMLMDGLCAIVGSSSWAWCMAESAPRKPLSFTGFEHGGWAEDPFPHHLGTPEHAGNRSIHPASEISSIREFWAQADIGPLILHQKPLPDGGISGIAVYRETGRPEFDGRESRIIHVVLSEVSWLHFTAFPERKKKQQTIRLQPRHRTILKLLCKGSSRKAIAADLGVSENTVHGYVKDIFRHFHVNSQSQLIAHFTKGDDGDKP